MSGDSWDNIRLGEVVAVDAASCRVRVHFDELDLTSDPLPVMQHGARDLRSYWLPGIGEHVVCVFYSDGSEEGVVVGSYYPLGSPPPESGAGVMYTVFPDGSLVKWDAGELTIVAHGGVTITGDTSISGAVSITGDVTVVGTVYAQQFVDTLG
jgi:phage baseplate assembly protein V